MTAFHLFAALGGLGLFLFSLRTLTRVLQRTLSRRLRGIFGRALGHPIKCLLSGLAGTVVVQASSITVMSSMSMVGSTLITLEQGYFLMLGATLGTTFKVWLLGANALQLGPLLVGVSSLSLLVVRRNSLRDLLEGILAIGLALWGMALVGQGLAPLLDYPAFQELVRGSAGLTLAEQATGVLLGLVGAACVQSSSTVVLLVIGMAGAGQLSYPQAAALILGANVGTTFGPLLASIEYGPNLRRLALAHFLCKFFGVLITLFFFPQFIGAWAWLVPDTLDPVRLISYRLAAVHTGFNLINLIWWTLFSGVILRLVGWLVPSRTEVQSSALAPVVRRMLGRSPERSHEEALRQMNLLVVCVKSLLDVGAALMVGERTSETRLESRILEQREFQGLKESTYELLVQASPGKAEDLRQMLGRLADLEELYFQALRLRDQLEHGLLREKLKLPAGLARLAETYQRCLDELWLRIVFPAETQPPDIDPAELGRELEDAYFTALREEEEMSSLRASWTFDVISNLRSVLLHTSSLARLRPRATEP